MVIVETTTGKEYYYAGAENDAVALLLAARAGHEGDAVTVKMIPNKFGVQAGEFRRAD
jgi:hypothetical protein